jgi:hypothetical protein
MPAIVAVGFGLNAGALIYAGLTTLLTATATFVIGIPVYALCRRLQWLSIWPFVAGGLLAGFIITMLAAMTLQDSSDLDFFAAVLCSIGAVHGALFWLVAIYRNETLAVLPPPTMKQ